MANRKRWVRPTIRDTGPCLEWPGYRNRQQGYGQFRLKGRKTSAHRAVWQHTYGPIPRGLLVMHWCDNPLCINIGHLTIGTHADNTADRIAKMRVLTTPQNLPTSK
jgi:hypothetical protein